MRASPRLAHNDWMLAAACRGMQGVFFAPDVLESKVERRRREARAKLICHGCPVRIECLTEAVESRERFGIWGGLTPRERRALVARTGSDSGVGGPRPSFSLPAATVRGRPMSAET